MANRPAFFLMIFAVLLISAQACALFPVSRKLPTPVSSIQVEKGVGLTPTSLMMPTMTSSPTVGKPLRVVYAKNNGIWLWGASTSPKQLTRSGQDSSPKISDDGQMVVFRRNADLWVVDGNGMNEHLLVSTADLVRLLPDASAKIVQPHQFDFSPHTHNVYFNTMVLTDTIPLFWDNLIRVDADSVEARLLLDSTLGGGNFVFSPDRSKVALPGSNKINVASADGAGVKTVFTFPPVKLNDDVNYIPEIVWLPDGSGFKTVIPAPDRSASTRWMFISADGAIVAKLAEFAASPVNVNRPFISPDGSKVLYTKSHGASLELHIIDAGTADQMVFSDNANAFGLLGWTPDSAHIFYRLGDQIWLGPEHVDAVALSDVPNASHLIWVDAQSYLFIASASQLRFCILGQPSILVDDGLSESNFDFITAH